MGIVSIVIRVKMALDDAGYLNSEQEKALDDLCCDLVDLAAKNNFEVTHDEWDIDDIDD